jgi:hypothetical protein
MLRGAYTLPMDKRQAQGDVKTSVWLPGDLWKRAKIAAVEERVDLRDIIVRALTAYLTPRKERTRR